MNSPTQAVVAEFKQIALANGYNCFGPDGASAYPSARAGSVSLNWCEKTNTWIALAYDRNRGSFVIANILFDRRRKRSV
jgi:hypothetical protein